MPDLCGRLGFATMVGIRAWVSFACPQFAKIAAGLVASAVFTMLSFSSTGSSLNLVRKGYRYVQLLLSKAWKERSPTMAMAIAIAAYSATLLVQSIFKLCTMVP